MPTLSPSPRLASSSWLYFSYNLFQTFGHNDELIFSSLKPATVNEPFF